MILLLIKSHMSNFPIPDLRFNANSQSKTFIAAKAFKFVHPILVYAGTAPQR
jgi:hypothetical protein